MKFLELALLHTLMLAITSSSSAINILGIFPTASESHYIVGESLMLGLAADGHNVTVISPFPQKSAIPNFHDYPLVGIVEELKKQSSNMLNLQTQNVYQKLSEMYTTGLFYTNYTLKHPRMTEFIARKDTHFDVIICEIFVNEALLGFGQHFGAPVIGLDTLGATMWTMEMVGSPAPLSYVPSRLLSLPNHMNFAQRVGNTLFSALDAYVYHQYLTHQEHLYMDVFPGDQKPTLGQIRKNVSLVLINQHFSTSFPQPLVPNMIEIGGIHVNSKLKNSLPNDVRQFIESDDYGVVYFSLGTTIQSSELPTKTRDFLLKVFGQLKQRVLWKWETPDLPGKPDNVMIRTWFPQNDILQHPNVKVFITHGGLLSITEAGYHGVSVISIPMFGDQFLNAFRAEKAGFGLNVVYSNLTETSISWALNEMLHNEKYSRQAAVVSQHFTERPIQPLALAKYWVIYIASHKGAPHLQSAGQDLPFIMYHNLDVFMFIGAAIGFVVYFIIYIILSIRRFVGLGVSIRQSKIQKKDTKKKN